MKKWGICLIALVFAVSAFGRSFSLKSQTINSNNKPHSYVKSSSNPLTFGTDYSEDFESGATGWTSTVNIALATWHSDTFQAFGGTGKSWWMGGVPYIDGYDNLWYQTITSPSIILPDSALTLAFKMNIAVEPTSSDNGYDGWDGCNVRISTDGGVTWTVLTSPTPAYDGSHFFCFAQHGEGNNMPGWAGTSGNWMDASFDLSAYANDTVMIRWVFASDPLGCTTDDAALFGWQIDSINVAGVFTNDGEDTTGFTFAGSPQQCVDRWVLIDSVSHSPTHSYQCVKDTNLMDALISPEIVIPNNDNPILSYYVYCDMPDWDGNADSTLEDFYTIGVSTNDGKTWNSFAYDHAGNGSESGWVQRDSGILVADNQFDALALNAYKGDTVRFRWLVMTDNNDDGGVGTGLYIDDINITSVGIEDNKKEVSTYSLSNCSPNPFIRNTEIKYSIPGNTHSSVRIFNISGQEIVTLVDKEQKAGSYTVGWNGKDKTGKLVPTGMYLYQLKSGNFCETKKVVLMR
ncbi:MAG: T9SS type A sorting domain-containing protein [bacterium]|nr:T9SS type A sorting domain-containing protein [bacterium]